MRPAVGSVVEALALPHIVASPASRPRGRAATVGFQLPPRATWPAAPTVGRRSVVARVQQKNRATKSSAAGASHHGPPACCARLVGGPPPPDVRGACGEILVHYAFRGEYRTLAYSRRLRPVGASGRFRLQARSHAAPSASARRARSGPCYRPGRLSTPTEHRPAPGATW